MSKLERLLNLSALLLNSQRPVSADYIASTIEGYPQDPASFRRAFERDKDELRGMGIRIEVAELVDADKRARNKDVGYVIADDGFYLPDPALTPDEMMALQLAATLVHVGDFDHTDAFRKLGGLDASVDLNQPVVEVPATPNLAVLFQAASEHRSATFGYKGSVRIVEVHRLELLRGNWYATGYDQTREGSRSFRVDRIEDQVQLGEPLISPHPQESHEVELEPWRYRFGTSTPVTLAVDAPYLRQVASFLGVELDESQSDLPQELHVEVFETSSFVRAILAFFDHVEILEPAELRNEMISYLTGLNAHHRTS